MKHRYLSAAILTLAIPLAMGVVAEATAVSGETQLQNPCLEASPAMKLQVLNPETGNISMNSPQQSAAMAEAGSVELTDILGTYISRDISMFTPEQEDNAILEIKMNGDKVVVSNLYRLGADVTATWNASTSSLSIAPQEIYKHETYGSCTVNTWTPSTSMPVFDESKPITITVNSNGSLSMSPWGIFVAGGDKKGQTFESYTSSTLYHPNGTMSRTTYGLEAPEDPYPVLLVQDDPTTLAIGNFLGNGSGYKATLYHDKTAVITPQYVMSQSIYGDFWLFSAKENTSKKTLAIDKSTMIKLTPDEGKITISPWGVYCLRSTDICAANAITSSITTDFVITYPEATGNLSGDGTKENPYKINNADDLRLFSMSVTASNTYKDKYVVLTSDIDLSQSKDNWTPIGGVSEVAFDGNFDGQNHSIKGLKSNFYGQKYGGLFGYAGTNSTIANLNVVDFDYISSGTNIGGVVALSKGSVSNCHTSGAINCTSVEIGGVVGISGGTIKDCSFDGTISGGVDMGGIVGYSSGSVNNCHANASITLATYIPNGYGTHAAGGIAGAMYGKSAAPTHVADCYFSGSISDPQKYDQLGGIVGAMYVGTIDRCFSVGRITCYGGAGVDGNSPCAGGILGYSNESTITNCYNAGPVSAANTNFASGIIGYAGGSSASKHIIRNCYNSGMVNANSKVKHAAFAGDNFKVDLFTLDNSYYDVQTTGLEYESICGLNTEDLISGTPLEGFDTDVWVFEKGLYPRLKGMDTNAAAYLSAAPVLLSNGENIKKIKKSFGVSVANDIKWGFLTSDGKVSPECDGLKVAGNQVTLNNKYALESLIAYNGDGMMKHYILRVVPSLFKGSGTEDDPYQIATVEDLKMLRDATDTYLQTHKGDYFKQTADIDVAGSDFKGIAADGVASHYFGGTYDGGNHYIHNLKIEAAKVGADGKLDSSSSHSYAGLFGICTETSTIKNIRIADDSEFAFYRYSAPVVGYTMGKVENCYNYADVKSYSMYNGGVVGAAVDGAEIKHCLNTGNIDTFDGSVGGIVGYSMIDVEGCQNIGNVSLTQDANFSTGTGIKNVGGIVGMSFGSVSSCVNGGTITGMSHIGGIVGTNSINSTTKTGGNVTGSFNYGMIRTTNESINIGGIIGNKSSFLTIKDNYYDSQIGTNGGADSNDADGITGMSTAKLTAGETIDGWDGYTFIKNSYPMLSVFQDDECVKEHAACILMLSSTDVRDAIENEATLLMPSGAKATLGTGAAFSINGTKLSLNLGDKTSEDDVLTLSGNKTERVFPIKGVASLFAGAGTEDDPHLITSKSDMTKLAAAVNESGRSFTNHNFRLTADLDYKDDAYTVIGDRSGAIFKGIFDGNGKKISNVVIGNSTDKTSLQVGLFGRVGPGACIRRLTVDGGEISAYQYAGAVAGNLAGRIENCVSTADVNVGNGYGGGIAGAMQDGASITGSINKGSVSATAGNYVGGISAVSYGSLIDCSNEGDVIGASGYAGGLVGAARGTIANGKNSGMVMLAKSGNYVGGIAAIVEPGSWFHDCENTGELSGGKNYVGGIYGGSLTTAAALKANGALVERCINRANLSSTGTNIGGITGVVAPGQYLTHCKNYGNITAQGNLAAGIAAEIKSSKDYVIAMDSCENFGKIEQTVANKQNIGGIIGKASSGLFTLADCVNRGEIISKGYMVGGIAGNFEGPVTGCVNIGNVTGATYAIGGIAGYGGSASMIDGCINGGNVTATGVSTNKYGTAAGILGYGYTKVANSANFGNVSGNDHVAGIAGTGFNGISVNNCYNAGNVTAAKEGAANVGNVYSGGKIGDNNYYISTNSPSYDKDANGAANGITYSELLNLNLGDGFVYEAATFPVPAYSANTVEGRFHTAYYKLAEGDTEDAVAHDFMVGTAAGLDWSVDDTQLATVNDGYVQIGSAVNKKFVLSCTDGLRTKHYEFTISNTSTGIDNTVAAREIISREYYTVGGMLTQPTPGNVYIVITKYADGTTETIKAMVK